MACFYEPLHLRRLALGRLDHLELDARAVQIVAFTPRSEIDTALQKISQEAQANLERDQSRRESEVLPFGRSEKGPG